MISKENVHFAKSVIPNLAVVLCLCKNQVFNEKDCIMAGMRFNLFTQAQLLANEPPHIQSLVEQYNVITAKFKAEMNAHKSAIETFLQNESTIKFFTQLNTYDNDYQSSYYLSQLETLFDTFSTFIEKITPLLTNTIDKYEKRMFETSEGRSDKLTEDLDDDGLFEIKKEKRLKAIMNCFAAFAKDLPHKIDDIALSMQKDFTTRVSNRIENERRQLREVDVDANRLGVL